MTATQVQRTLVKSAPEIWAELSDPEALARHLDPVGEIRITRAQPEEKIEWETEDARGSVLIKPSGWGTRVTLTMSREEDPTPSAAGAEAPLHAAPEALAGSPAEIASKPEQQTAVPPEPETVEPRVQGPAFQSEPETVERQVQGPAVASEPQASAAESEPEASAAEPEIVEPEYEAPETEPPLSMPVVAAGEPEPPAEPELEHDTPSQRPDLLPRRGFLARLLRRRGRRGAPAESSGAGAQVHGLAPREPSPWPTASAEWVEQFPIRQPDTEIAPAVAEPETAPEDMLGDTETPPDDPVAAADMAGDTETPPDDTIAGTDMPGDTETSPDDLAAGAEGMTIGDERYSQAPPEQDHVEQQPAPAGDDAAVLSAMLDRLGAAHHRPFSRG